ncbi:MAG: hypothetical protein WGN25_06135 [Candidatus Electrothrix sp. GW3-4]|uniref:hypothetical protein n=1 Tax=Candidatus Electrothrix sp. GW3-4 TaxID=3126740 RepID=UPI0030D022BF
MPTPFSPDQLEALCLDMDEQLKELRNSPSFLSESKAAQQPEQLPERTPKQWQIIAVVTREDPQSFWQRFKQAAHSDLCEEGGVLHAQWRRYRNLSSKAVLESFGALLVAMGFSGNALQVLAVALGVIVMHLGCTAICKE